MFEYLFYCTDNIPDGLGFSLFSLGHLIWLAVIAAMIVWGCKIYGRSDERGRLKIRRTVSALLIADELLKMAVLMSTGWYTVDYLPLHLCSINIFVCLWYTLKPSRLAAESLYALSIPGALVALCSPTWTELPYMNLMSFHSFSIHGLLILYPMLLITSGEHRPALRNIWRPAVFLMIVCPFIYLFNSRFGTNYMFMNDHTDNILSEIIVSVTGTSLYMVGLLVLVFVVWLILYLPWEVAAKLPIKTRK